MNNENDSLGDDVPCSKCGAVALDTGLECTECGHDMRPELYPESPYITIAAQRERIARLQGLLQEAYGHTTADSSLLAERIKKELKSDMTPEGE